MGMNEIKNNITKLSEKYIIIYYLVIIILVNAVSLTLYFRLDLTKNGAYSISSILKRKRSASSPTQGQYRKSAASAGYQMSRYATSPSVLRR